MQSTVNRFTVQCRPIASISECTHTHAHVHTHTHTTECAIRRSGKFRSYMGFSISTYVIIILNIHKIIDSRAQRLSQFVFELNRFQTSAFEGRKRCQKETKKRNFKRKLVRIRNRFQSASGFVSDRARTNYPIADTQKEMEQHMATRRNQCSMGNLLPMAWLFWFIHLKPLLGTTKSTSSKFKKATRQTNRGIGRTYC